MTDLGEVGEFGLIARIAAIVGENNAVLGIGDDAAVIDQPGADYLLATVDMLVENVHFRSAQPPRDIGARAFAVNASDIAAMGGRPRYALVSLAIPLTARVEYIEEIYRGFVGLARVHDVSIVGGNLTRTEGPLSIDVTLLGDVPKTEVVRRSGARIGDAVVVSGVLGAAAADLRLFEAGKLDRLPPPQPRVGAARALAAWGGVHAMMDLSDGLGSDIHHLAAASGVGAVVNAESVPVAFTARRAAGVTGSRPLDLALFGGEDYELLLTLPRERVDEARQVVGDLPLAVVGTILHLDDGVLLETGGGVCQPLEAAGWRHF